MSLQKLHAFEKTSIQARHAMKRLEMLCDTTRDENEKTTARALMELFKSIRLVIPPEYHDVDLKEKE